jgi:hypothetical protein
MSAGQACPTCQAQCSIGGLTTEHSTIWTERQHRRVIYQFGTHSSSGILLMSSDGTVPCFFLSFFLSFLVWLLIPTHCRRRGLLLRLNTLGRTPLDERSARLRYLCLYNTQHSQKTDIHASGGTRTRNSRRRAAADQRLRLRGHRDRLPCLWAG